VLWTKAASERHDQTAYDIALQYGEQAAHTYLDGIEQALAIIADHPHIGRSVFSHLPYRRRHVTSRGWEIYYDDDAAKGRIVVVDTQRGPAEPMR
jgi:plasmid stabilization system protein ParE